MFSGHVDDDVKLRRAQERLSKWCKRCGFSLVWLWVREIGKNEGRNTHILVHVPPKWAKPFRAEFERAFEREGGAVRDQAILCKRANRPGGKLAYMLKGMSDAVPEQLEQAIGMLIKVKGQGVVLGKRTGTTENIGQAARNRRRRMRTIGN